MDCPKCGNTQNKEDVNFCNCNSILKGNGKLSISEANEPFVSGLRVITAEKGLKNLYVAEKAGFTAQELSDMLNGWRLIKACDIPKFAKALNVKLDDIYAIGMRGR